MNARRQTVRIAPGLCALIAVLALAAPAFAAAPEAPETLTPQSISGTGALLQGLLNPGKEGAPGSFEIDTYEFLYNQASAGKCAGGAKTTETISIGEGMQLVTEPVTALAEHTKYIACLATSNGTEAVGGPVSFITGPVEAPEVEAVSEIASTTAKFTGVLNPQHENEPGTYAFRYSSSAGDCGGDSTNVGEGVSTGKQGQAVSGEAINLTPGETYAFCLVVRQGGEEIAGAPVTFTAGVGAPAISQEAVASVASDEATVSAQIAAGGLPTSYRVEYGTSSAYGASTPEASVGAGGAAVAVRAQLDGLQPSEKYHFRVVAKNELGERVGEDQAFVTTSSAGGSISLLPDDRAYELVSAPTENITVASLAGDEHGTSLVEGDEGGEQPYQAAAGGNALAYAANPALEGGNGAFADGQSNEWIATRGPTGWTGADITAIGTDAYDEYALFSNDLSVGIFLADDGTRIPASPEAPPGCTWNVYSRTADGSYHSLITHPGTSGECGYPVAPDVAADGSHLLFASKAALTAGSVAGKEYSYNDVYDSVAGALYQVNVLPDGQPEPAPDASLGGPPALGGEEHPPDYSNAVSSDGSRVFWTSIEQVGREYVPTALYLRENDAQPQSPVGPGSECTVVGDACTVQVDVAEPKCVAEGHCTSGGGLFWTATTDGARVFFTDPNRLTANSTAEPGEPDLYEYEVDTRQLTDLTVAKAGHANVQGVIGASEDGEYLYFAASGVLTSNENANGETAQKGSEEGQTGIYLLHDGVTTFIAAGGITFPDLYEEHLSDWSRGLNNRTAEVTPSGEAMIFESARSLTGYAGGAVEVFIYDVSTGKLSCASCDPAGAPPSEPVENQFTLLPAPGGGEKFAEQYQPRWLSASGNRAFFDTRQPLVPQDTNGKLDVYEWERPATGSETSNSCTTASASYSKVNGGCVYLLTGGQTGDASYFADADAEGNNVFFTSRGQLTPQIANENVAMYDARVDGGFPELSTACTGTGCQGVPPAPPIFATPSSVTYNGVGNFEPQPTVVHKTASKRSKCEAGKIRKGGKCIKAKKAKRPRKRAKRRKK